MFPKHKRCRPRLPKKCLRAWLLLLFLSASSLVSAERLTLNFDPDWKFTKADPTNAANVDFNASAWASVSLPHTYNDTDTFDHWSLPGHRGEQNQWGGRTWYRKTFTLPAAWRGRKFYLEFEAARQVADVYLNGHFLGVSKTGFIPFGFDLTPWLRFDAPNVLAVMCDSRFMKDPPAEDGVENIPLLSQISARVNAGIPENLEQLEADQIPWNNPHWHPPHGGIYRNVYLHVTDPLHISLPLYSFLQTVGPYVYATNISTNAATVNLEVPVENGRAKDAAVEVTAKILDGAGREVMALKQAGDVAAGSKKQFKLAGALKNPLLWNVVTPNVYHVVLSVRDEGELVDTAEVPLGIRTARWDVKTGFWLNDQHLKLHGWGQKPTDEWPGLGAAQPDWLHYYTLALMKEAGGNWVRWGHCAAAPAMIEAGDQLGIMAEQPGVDGESDTVGAAWKLRLAAFRDMLIYFRNHPSIVIWEGGNQKVTREHAQQLRNLLQQYDPAGGRAFAFRRADQMTGSFMDVDIGTEGDRQVPQLPVVEGEYDREESPRRVWDNFSPPNFGYPEARGQSYQLTSEQYAVNQVSQYVGKLGDPGHAGGANWIFSDSTSGGRVACEVARASGEVDGARLPKEAYYVCQTMFRSDPQIHIIGHWNYSNGTKKTVYVASNCQDVELFLNGKSLGHGKNSDRYLFTFENVLWESGEIKAVGYNHDQVVVTAGKHTVGPPVALRLTPIVGPTGFLADGSDVALVDVEAVDAHGERCPTFQQRVDFNLAGPALWRGGYNSGKTNSINNPFLDLECGINRVAVRSQISPGLITIAAHCEGLRSAALELTSKPLLLEHGYAAQLPPLPAAPKLDRFAFGDTQSPGETGMAAKGGRFLTAFSYSGPTGAVRVWSEAKDGAKIYTDRDYVFRDLPAALAGSDWIQTATADKFYSAADLLDFAMKSNGMVYVAYDNRLPAPDWLQRQFRPTDITFLVNGQPMKIFARSVHGGESLTLGSNAESSKLKSCNMYIVFLKDGLGTYQVSR